MSSPVELNDLPVASIANNADTTLLRQGLTDYQCAVGLIRNIDIPSLTPIPNGYANASDTFIINRSGMSGPSNYQIAFSQVGFVKGTQMWFYNGGVPAGWTAVPNTGDRLLAVSDGVNNYNTNAASGSQSGTWQQTDWILTVAQLPKHSHSLNMGNDSGGQFKGFFETAQTSINKKAFTSDGGDAGLKGEGHNHGLSWRPAANVGIIGIKSS